MKSIYRLDASSRCILYSAKLSPASLAKGGGKAYVPAKMPDGCNSGIAAMSLGYRNCKTTQEKYNWLQKSGWFGVIEGEALKKMGVTYHDKGLKGNKAAETAVNNLTAPFTAILRKLGFPSKVLKNFGSLSSALISLGAMSGGSVDGYDYGTMSDPLNMPFREQPPTMNLSPKFNLKFSYGSCNLFNATEEVYKPIASLWQQIAPVRFETKQFDFAGQQLEVHLVYAGDPFPNEFSAQVGAVKAAMSMVVSGVKEIGNASKAIVAANSEGNPAAYFSDLANVGIYPNDSALPIRIETCWAGRNNAYFADNVKVFQPASGNSKPTVDEDKLDPKKAGGEAMSEEEYSHAQRVIAASRDMSQDSTSWIDGGWSGSRSNGGYGSTGGTAWTGLNKWWLASQTESSWANDVWTQGLDKWEKVGDWINTNNAGFAFKKTGETYRPTMPFNEAVAKLTEAENGKKEGGTALVKLGQSLAQAYLTMVQQTKIKSVTQESLTAWYIDAGFKPSTEVDIITLADNASLPLIEYGPFALQKASYSFDLTHLDDAGVPTSGEIKIEGTIPLLGYGASIAFRNITEALPTNEANIKA